MSTETNTTPDPIEATWNRAYPDRRPWDQIGTEAQAEWRRVFAIFADVTGAQDWADQNVNMAIDSGWAEPL